MEKHTQEMQTWWRFLHGSLKSFDKINHDLLIAKLEVSINSSFNTWEEIIAGVP